MLIDYYAKYKKVGYQTAQLRKPNHSNVERI